MRVLLVNKFHWRKGGSETYYFGLADGLRAAGHEVAFFSMADERNEPTAWSKFFVSNKDYNGPSSPLDKARAAKSLIYSKESLEKFDALCREFEPDIIHLNLVHRQITLSILDAPWLEEHPTPVVFTAHDYILVCPNYTMLDGGGKVCDACLGGKFSSCAKRKCVKGSTAKSALAAAEAEYYKKHGMYSRIDHIVTPSEFMRDKLIEGGFDAAKVTAMKNFVGKDIIALAESAEDGTDWDSPYFLFFGRLSHEKGVDVLIDAFSRATDVLRGWRLVIAGEGPEREKLERFASELGVLGKVQFVGFQTGAVLRATVSGAAFSAAPARWREVLSYSNTEAFAQDTPVIATRMGGMPELVEDGVTGLLVEPENVGGLAGTLVRAAEIFADEALYKEMRSHCRKRVLHECDPEIYMREMTALYGRLVAQKRG